MRYVYMLWCADNSIYTGITTNLDRRIYEHNHKTKWASYTKGKRPVNLLWSQQSENRSTATKLEIQIKKLTKKQKIKMITNAK